MAKKEAKAKVTKKPKPDAGAATGSVVNRKYLDNYTKSETKTASGKRYATDIGDDVAAMMRGKTMDELAALAKKNGFEELWNTKYAKLNPGLARMSLGNKLRGKLHPSEKKVAKAATKKAEKAEKKAEKPAKKAEKPAKKAEKPAEGQQTAA